MSDQPPARPRRAGSNPPPKSPPQARDPDYAAHMARAEFGRFYLDPERVEQTLRDGEIVFRPKTPPRRPKPWPE